MARAEFLIETMRHPVAALNEDVFAHRLADYGFDLPFARAPYVARSLTVGAAPDLGGPDGGTVSAIGTRD